MQILIKTKTKGVRPLSDIIIKYLRETWRNKLFAIGMIIVGILSMYAAKDATVMVYMAIFAILIFFEKRDIWKNH